MSRPRLLDLFCGPGGASVGYRRAGFDVVGVDIEPWDCYPGECRQADAMAVLRGEVAGLEPWRFDAIHASPPCQFYSSLSPAMAAAHKRAGRTYDPGHADMVGDVRDLLGRAGKPYIIENVVGAPGPWDMMVCGTMFALPVARHRRFAFGGAWEPPAFPPASCNHSIVDPVASAYYSASRRRSLGVRQREAERTLLDALGLDWVPMYAYENRTQPGAIEGIPPAFTEWIGAYLAESLP